MRRSVVRCMAALLTLLALLPLAACGLGPFSRAIHVILFIGDGMQLEHEIAGSRYLYGTDKGLSWQSWPAQCHVTTWDVTTYDAYASDSGSPSYAESSFDLILGYSTSLGGSAPFPDDASGANAYLLRAATDSAAAATAMATGVKTDAGNIAWSRGDPTGGELATILELMRDRKAASTGVVTTVAFNHATPAAFASHAITRADYSGIASQVLFTTRPDVVVGGGHPAWSAAFFSTAELAAVKADAGWMVVERTAGVAGGAALKSAAVTLADGVRLLGLFGGSSGDFEQPQPVNAPGSPGFGLTRENPSLAEEVEAALTVLARNQDGFFLVAEQGTIDHASHANDYAGIVGGVHDLDEAVRAAEAYIDAPGDDLDWDNTLIIVTADHANGLMRLTGAPSLGAGELPAQAGSPPATYPGGEVTWGTTGHTNELVTLAARGARSYLFTNRQGLRYPGTRIIDNTDIHAVLMKAAGLE